jgi:hypothetical protein
MLLRSSCRVSNMCVQLLRNFYFSTDFYESLQRQISRKLVQREMSWYMHTGKKNAGQIWWSYQEFFVSKWMHLQTHLKQLGWWVQMWTEWATSELWNSSCMGHQTKYASAQHTVVVQHVCSYNMLQKIWVLLKQWHKEIIYVTSQHIQPSLN